MERYYEITHFYNNNSVFIIYFLARLQFFMASPVVSLTCASRFHGINHRFVASTIINKYCFYQQFSEMTRLKSGLSSPYSIGSIIYLPASPAVFVPHTLSVLAVRQTACEAFRKLLFSLSHFLIQKNRRPASSLAALLVPGEKSNNHPA